MRMSQKEYKQFMESHPELKEKLNNKKPFKNSKFRNTKVYLYNGMPSYVKLSDKEYEMVFDSIKEFHRWNELKTLEKAGEISKLERQKKFVIQPAFKYKEEKLLTKQTFFIRIMKAALSSRMLRALIKKQANSGQLKSSI